MSPDPAAKAPAALPTRTPGASGRAPVNPPERLNDVQLIAARDKLRNRLKHADPDQPRHANITAAFGLFAAEIARRTAQAKQAANRQGQPRK
jgi:hypothetical protein